MFLVKIFKVFVCYYKLRLRYLRELKSMKECFRAFKVDRTILVYQ